MKIPPSNFDPQWENLLKQARADVGPTVDTQALLRAVRLEPLAPRESWIAEFSALFSSGRVIPTCLAGACAFALIASWEAWNAWQEMPWAQLLDTATGGGL